MKPLAHAVPGGLRQLLHNAPLSDGKVAFAWRMVVGAALDRATAVKLENGVLLVDTASAQWARELKRSQSMILPRLQAMLGEQNITRIELRTPHSALRNV